MLTALIIGMALNRQLPWVQTALILLTWGAPQIAAPVLATLILLARSQHHKSEPEMVAFHRTLATELRAGLSLRMAVVAACDVISTLDLRPVVRLAAAGHPLEQVASALRRADSRLRPAASALRVAAMTGGSAVSIFDALTAEAVEDEAVQREQRSLSGPVKLSVAIVGGFPILVASWHVASGELNRLLAWGLPGRVMVFTGLGLLTTGLFWVLRLLRGARR